MPQEQQFSHIHSNAGSHNHSHGNDNMVANRTRLTYALAITGTVLLAELVGAAWTGSLSLLVDAAHMLTDTLGLVVALIASILVTRPASSHRSWGWRRAEVIAAAAQSAILLVVGLYAIVEAVQRLINPPNVLSQGLAAIGFLGLAANILSMLVLTGGRKNNLNMRAAFLEVVNDALGSIAVLAAAAVIYFTGWKRADAIAGLFVAMLILPRAIKLLKESSAILLESTPEGLDLNLVKEHMLAQPHVVEIHDLHASTVSSGLPVLSAHVVIENECFKDGHYLAILERLTHCINEHHAVHILHSTLQLETAEMAASHKESVEI